MQIKSEWDLLKAIKGLIDKKGIGSPPDLIESIGDDCAVFKLHDNKLGLITTDISIESVHFRRDLSSLEDIGFKAMMGNISDIASMGGKAKYAFISAGVPEGFMEEEVFSLYEGMIEASNMADVIIAGGDTSRSKEIVLNIALYGEVPENNCIRRKGACAGDIIYVTGSLGDSMAGLELLLSGNADKVKQYPGLIEKHRRPVARFNMIDDIISKFSPASMIDISDGLLSDLRHICENSRAGFELVEKQLPVSKELVSYARYLKKSPHNYALESGEEYELLFTSRKISLNPADKSGMNPKATPIGKIIESGFYILKDDKRIEISISGFDHFNRK